MVVGYWLVKGGGSYPESRATPRSYEGMDKDGSRCLREKKSVQTRENLIGEPAWEEMTRLFAPSLRSRDNEHFLGWG